ncbi:MULTISPECIES: hypothetical protein [unclassified Methylosinus]|uniref:hypothetical protein n=1 Tax=unclassified Methylosinus TaxID=2624500 RepID=UPI0018DBC25D|nr:MULTISPECIES: hypothetical protein [unclassified Methylosinus]
MSGASEPELEPAYAGEEADDFHGYGLAAEGRRAIRLRMSGVDRHGRRSVKPRRERASPAKTCSHVATMTKGANSFAEKAVARLDSSARSA